MDRQDATLASRQSLSPSHIATLGLAAAKRTGAKRRACQAALPLKSCGGSPLLAENRFGWGRRTVEMGLAEHRTGILGLGAPAAFSSRTRWEDKQPQVAEALRHRRGVRLRNVVKATPHKKLAEPEAMTTSHGLHPLERAGVISRA